MLSPPQQTPQRLMVNASMPVKGFEIRYTEESRLTGSKKKRKRKTTNTSFDKPQKSTITSIEIFLKFIDVEGLNSHKENRGKF